MFLSAKNLVAIYFHHSLLLGTSVPNDSIRNSDIIDDVTYCNVHTAMSHNVNSYCDVYTHI